MIWDYFIFFAIAAIVLWAFGAMAAWKGKTKVAVATTGLGLAIFLAFIIAIWITFERPPLRTMGETRLWYSFFLPLAGLLVYARRRYRWLLSFTTVLSSVFICVNIFKPEIHTKALMPALQSPWFAPHVIVYMMAYAILGAATLMAVYYLIKAKRGEPAISDDDAGLELDGIVRAGLAFLTFGMLFGALWAKEAWGHYWSWDPKETWAAITWLGYLLYIHFRSLPRHNTRLALWLLIIAFVLLQMCWWGINYLPSAQATSVHTY
ncbi:MAG: cytochrome c biogenesis protein CcsA [Bacteroidaceae bacterium]|nr:cytochrome c biogenesis protein CcsA [Bacteroidaceae bacterium]